MSTRRAGTTAHIATFEDRFLDRLDFITAFGALWKRRGIRPSLEEFVRLLKAGKPMKARRALSPLYVIQVTKDALTAKRAQDRTRACEVALRLANEFPAEKRSPQGGDGSSYPPVHLHFDMSKLTTDELRQLRQLTTKARPALVAGLGNGNGESGDD